MIHAFRGAAFHCLVLSIFAAPAAMAMGEDTKGANTKVEKKSQPVKLSQGASGRLVEDLQRTLNARLKAELSVDGDFGAETKAAVERWQRKRNLPVNGVVDRKTWASLGQIVTSDSPPPPNKVNAEVLPKAAADSLDGPPLVTCKAWVIVDRKTGEVLASQQAKRRLNFASTTKIMTAYLVLRWAEGHPEALDEVVEFSKRADKTGGSTAGVRAGERLPVRELLYGLLLPSGNDASVALAEHFGERLSIADRPPQPSERPQSTEKPASKKESEEKDARSLFVDGMNRAATEFGMAGTRFENPHGLTAKGHLSTANDLATLARRAMELPTFRAYVSTRQRGCALQAASGDSRNVVWKNTNRLLGIEGFEGVKTGTTSAAGACLVSAGSREGRQLIMVVLGASSSNARYVDSRNLYRWVWRTLPKQK